MTPLDTSALLSIDQALAQAKSKNIDRLDAQQLLAHLFNKPRSWIVAHPETNLSYAQLAHWHAQLNQRCQGVPLAYLLGTKEFYGLSLTVNPDVLIPRPETETLVDWSLELLCPMSWQPPLGHPLKARNIPQLLEPISQYRPLRPIEPITPQILDLGTGSGAIALALQHKVPWASVCASDNCPKALAVAQHNATQLGLNVTFIQSHWFEALTNQTFDLIVSNPPYIAALDPHLTALHFEPRQALVSGDIGLDDLYAQIEQAPAYLRKNGCLLLEHGYSQGPAVTQALRLRGFSNIQTRTDLAGLERCTGGCWLG